MNKNFNSFLAYTKGKWLLYENFYYFLNKELKNYESKINFLTKVNNYEAKNNEETYINNNFINLYEKQKLIFKVEKAKKNILFISTTKTDHKTYYKEYIDYSNENVIISLSILKNVRDNEYIGLKVSSYIRVI